MGTGGRGGKPAEIQKFVFLGTPADPNIVIQSLAQHMIMISDMPPSPATGGIVLRSFSGAMIRVNESRIYLSNRKGATIAIGGKQIDFNVGAVTILTSWGDKGATTCP